MSVRNHSSLMRTVGRAFGHEWIQLKQAIGFVSTSCSGTCAGPARSQTLAICSARVCDEFGLLYAACYERDDSVLALYTYPAVSNFAVVRWESPGSSGSLLGPRAGHLRPQQCLTHNDFFGGFLCHCCKHRLLVEETVN